MSAESVTSAGVPPIRAPRSTVRHHPPIPIQPQHHLSPIPIAPAMSILSLMCIVLNFSLIITSTSLFVYFWYKVLVMIKDKLRTKIMHAHVSIQILPHLVQICCLRSVVLRTWLVNNSDFFCKLVHF